MRTTIIKSGFFIFLMLLIGIVSNSYSLTPLPDFINSESQINSTQFSGLHIQSGDNTCSNNASYKEKLDSMKMNTQNIQSPFYFIKNEGQVDKKVLSYANIKGNNVWFTDDGMIIFDINSPEKRDVIRMNFKGKNPDSYFETAQPLQGKVNYFIGDNPDKWRKDIPIFQEAIYRNLYNNIDLKLYENKGQIEYDFVVKPGGKISDIKLVFEGGKKNPFVAKNGELEIKLSQKSLKHKKPVVNRVINGERKYIKGEYIKNKDSSFSFVVASYKKDTDLIIDPAVELLYSTYLGGTKVDAYLGEHQKTAVTTDSNRNIYLATATMSNDFPLGNINNQYKNGYDINVSKLSPDGQTLIYSTYIGGAMTPPSKSWVLSQCQDGVRGGEAHDFPTDIEVNALGQVFVAGDTKCYDYPVVNGADNGDDNRTVACDGYFDAVITKLDQNGSSILYSSYLGGENHDYSAGIKLIDNEILYLIGHASHTESYQIPFPSKNNNSINKCEQSKNIFIAKFDTGKTGDSSLLASFCVGGPPAYGGMLVNDADSDSLGNIYVVGHTEKETYLFKNGYSSICGYVYNHPVGYLTKINPETQEVLYSTCFGHGTGSYEAPVYPLGVAASPDGLAYIVGDSLSSSFPLKNAFLAESGGDNSGFLTVFDTNKSGEDSLLVSTFLPCKTQSFKSEHPRSVALDNEGNVFVSGYTNCNTIISAQDSFQTANNGLNDNFLMKISPDGRFPYYSTYLGGSGDEYNNDITVDSSGNIIVAGYSSSTNFPLVDPLKSTYSGDGDVFLSKISFDTPPQSLMVTLSGPRFVTPGDTVDFVVNYKNMLPYDVNNVIVVVSLPMAAEFNSCKDCIKKYGEIFWKIGELKAGEQGLKTFSLKYDWGLPAHLKSQLKAWIDSPDSPYHVFTMDDINSYNSYNPVEIVSSHQLSANELNILLSNNSELKTMYDQAIAKGFKDYGVNYLYAYSNSETQYSLFLLKSDPYEVLELINKNNISFQHHYDTSKITFEVADTNGGLIYDLFSFNYTAWGLFGESMMASQAIFQNTKDLLVCEPSMKKCIDNCYKQYSKEGIYDFYKKIRELEHTTSCIQCLQYNDQDACNQCAAMMEIYKPIEFDMASCFLFCKTKPETYMCTDDRYVCSSVTWTKIAPIGKDDFGKVRVAWRQKYKCNPETCTYEAIGDPISCGDCSACVAGECKLEGDVFKSGKVMGWCIVPEVIVAGDPNDKVGFYGEVIPGQKLDYTINYENVGQGTAYGVYIIDKLDANLDETTLVINNGGIFYSSSREIIWNIGQLASQQKGSVSFSVNVKNDVLSGKEIINQATVYFPSVPEITPTNPVVNRVFAITANPQKLEVESGINLPVTLTGKDAGGASLTYSVKNGPLYGTLTGTPPNLTYKSIDNFSGGDSFTFTVNNGSAESHQAEISINVTPSSTDATAPQVSSTYPLNSETNVGVYTDPIISGTGYPPIISATFSEPLNSDTVTNTNFYVQGLSGTVSYNSNTWTAYFIPSNPLSYKTTYQATLTTGITDIKGNHLAQDHSWQFTTEALSYTITETSNPAAGGGVVCNPNPVENGLTTSCNITTNSGYSLQDVTGTCGGTLNGSVYTTNAITAPCTVQANFTVAPTKHAITATSNPAAGGGVVCNPNPVDNGLTSACNITTNSGYSLQDVTGTCGGTLNGSVYTTNAITAPCTVQANFKQLVTTLDNTLFKCDLDNNGIDEIIKIDENGNIYFLLGFKNWYQINGNLEKIYCGDINLDYKTDLVGIASDGSVYYSLDAASLWNKISSAYKNNMSLIADEFLTWQRISGSLDKIGLADLNGNGTSDIFGLNELYNIYLNYNLKDWQNISGLLNDIISGNFNMQRNGNELAGLNQAGNIYYTTDLITWINIPGNLSMLEAGDVNGDGKTDLIGLNFNGNIYFSKNLGTWEQIQGSLSYLATGDFNGDKKQDIIGITISNDVYYTTDLTTWNKLPGKALSLITGDFNGDGMDDVAVTGLNGKTYYTTNLTTWNAVE